MRTSLIIATLIAAPALLITACDASPAPAVKGTVVEKEYDPPKTREKRVPVTKQVCKTGKVKGKTRRTCTIVTTHKTTTVIVHKECYELDIRLASGSVTEVCDRYAYYALIPGDTYTSSTDYSKKVTWQ